jgi:hypothetical protein
MRLTIEIDNQSDLEKLLAFFGSLNLESVKVVVEQSSKKRQLNLIKNPIDTSYQDNLTEEKIEKLLKQISSPIRKTIGQNLINW